MGLLDDAIREHLELKRLRGADPAEIERAEREALGPVRRGPDEPGSAAPLPDGLEERFAYDHAADYHHEPEADNGHELQEPGFAPAAPADADEFDDPFAHEPAPPPPPVEHAGSPPVETPPPLGEPEAPVSAATRGGLPEAEPQPFEAEPHELEPAAPEFETEQRDLHPDGPETVEYDVGEELEKGGDDVLEETPEFLQDTPDHDRLWFEQKPPKDFDLGGS